MSSPKIIPMRFIDRSRTVQDWKCERSRYWGYEYRGKGISPATTSIELFMGIALHDALSAIAQFHKDGVEVPIDDIATAAHKQLYENLLLGVEGIPGADDIEYATEQAVLTEGLIRGFYLHVWPRLMALYPKIVAIETEMNYEMGDGFIFMTKPDIVVEDQEGELVYLEYKSTSSKKDNWIKSWETAVQLHSSIKATEATLGRPVSGVQIVGLYKGYESYGKQSSPFCYAYKKSGNPPFTQDAVEYAYKAGFKRYATWELPGGVKKWVEGMPENILATQFPMTPRIFVNEDLVAAFFKQRLVREQEIANFKLYRELEDYDETLAMDATFPQRFDQCVPSYGWSCPYTKLCHGYVPDPLAEGFVVREPHHAQEKEQYEMPGE